MAKQNLSLILKSALKRKQAQHPGYSLRALARDLEVSPAFVSGLLNGKKLPPKNRLEKLSYCLELDVLEKETLVKTVLLDRFSVRLVNTKSKSQQLKNWRHRKISEISTKNVLSSWVTIAVLEGLTLAEPFCQPESLQKRLGISRMEFDRAIESLATAGLIAEVDGKWRKKDEHLYLSGGRSRKEIREFHERMILKAREELMTKTSHEEFLRRLINGFTLAVNPAHIERLKAKVIRFLDELTQEASRGECVEVYQCNFQLFPLTKKL